MKFKCLFLLLWATTPMFSQLPLPPGLTNEIEVNTSYANQINAVFSTLDKSKIPNGLLQDFAMEYSALEAYTGTITDSTYVHPGTIKQLYSSLLMSRIDPSNSAGFVPYQNFENNWKDEREKNTITLSGLYFKYSKFTDNAYPDKISISNNKLYDKYINGVWQNPYEEERLFAISPSIVNYNGLNFSVKLPSNLWYTNDSSSVQAVQIDFGDGNGYVIVNPGQQLSVSYATEGIKTWTYKMSLNSGEVLFSHSKINFNDIPAHCPFGTGGGNGCNIETLQITSSKAYENSTGSVTLQINYGNTYGEIRRPLIVAEGLDLGAVIAPENPFGESDLISFLENVLDSSSDTLINQLVGNGSLYNNNQEYDIIYVNWNNGTDFIQRNAYALESVIEWVNSQKSPTADENVVIGQSMGGLVARYALKEMEDDENDHDTRLFVSQDSPHLGANIPVGYQYAVRNGRNQYIKSPVQLLGGDVIIPLFNHGVGASDYLGLLDQPAVKQMLIQWVGRDYTIDNTIHSDWQTHLNLKGYPQQTRNVAISNGSQCAITQGFDPGDVLFGVNGRVKTGWLTDILTSFTGIGNTINSAVFLATTIFTFEPGFLFGVLPGNSRLDADIQIRALPELGQTNQIYSANVTFTKKVLWLINITTTIINKNFDSPSNSLPYDYYSGGVVTTKIPSSSIAKSNALYGLNINVISDPDFVLVPTASALDIGKSSEVLNNSDYLKVYRASSPPLAPKDSPFDNFITSYKETPFKIHLFDINDPSDDINNFNQIHLDLFEDNGDWLASEIALVPDIYDCSFVCENLAINGPETLCSSGTYSVPNYGNANFTWNISPSTGITLTNVTSNEVGISYNSAAIGEYTLTVNIDSPECGSTELSKSFLIGKPDVKISALDSNAPSYQAWAYITGDGAPLSEQYLNGHPTFSVVSSSGLSTVTIQGPYSTGNEYKILGNGYDNYWSKTIDVFIENNCGVTIKRVFLTPPPEQPCNYTLQSTGTNTYAFIPPPDPCGSTMLVSSSTLMSSESDGFTQTDSREIKNVFNFKVFDIHGVLRLQTDEQEIDLSPLPKGMYIIKATWNGIEYTKKIKKK